MNHQPLMVHRALFGSVERFFGILLEHYAGALPTWLAPVQARIVPIADRHIGYATVVAGQLKAAGLRPEIDESAGRMQAKIRDAQLAKVPYILVLGDDGATYILARGERAFVMLNAFPYNPGHLMVSPYRHTGEYTDLTAEELAEMTALTGRAIAALREASGPHGFNLGMNLGQVG